MQKKDKNDGTNEKSLDAGTRWTEGREEETFCDMVCGDVWTPYSLLVFLQRAFTLHTRLSSGFQYRYHLCGHNTKDQKMIIMSANTRPALPPGNVESFSFVTKCRSAETYLLCSHLQSVQANVFPKVQITATPRVGEDSDRASSLRWHLRRPGWAIYLKRRTS